MSGIRSLPESTRCSRSCNSFGLLCFDCRLLLLRFRSSCSCLHRDKTSSLSSTCNCKGFQINNKIFRFHGHVLIKQKVPSIPYTTIFFFLSFIVVLHNITDELMIGMVQRLSGSLINIKLCLLLWIDPPLEPSNFDLQLPWANPSKLNILIGDETMSKKTKDNVRSVLVCFRPLSMAL